MNSTQVVDLHDVDAYWKSRNLVDDKHRPYCLRWLQRFLSGPWGAGRLAPNDALAAFAQHLEQDKRMEEWQVRQAVRSVELFQKHYLRHCQETGAAVPAAVAGQADIAGMPKTFAAALGETRTLIRLRHYGKEREGRNYQRSTLNVQRLRGRGLAGDGRKGGRGAISNRLVASQPTTDRPTASLDLAGGLRDTSGVRVSPGWRRGKVGVKMRNKIVMAVLLLIGLVGGAALEHGRLRPEPNPEVATPPVVRKTTPAPAAEGAALAALRQRLAELEQSEKVWREQNAELQRALAAARRAPPEESGDANARRTNRPPQVSFAERLAAMQRDNPEAFAEMQKGRDRFMQQIAQKNQERTAFLSSVDTANMNDEQRANHEQLLAAREKVMQMMDQAAQGNISMTPETGREYFSAMASLNNLYQQERRYLLEATGRTVGYEGDQAQQFADYVQSIYDNTTPPMSMPLNLGNMNINVFGPGGGAGRSGAPGRQE